jgi:ParB family chromosome partitioning protein
MEHLIDVPLDLIDEHPRLPRVDVDKEELEALAYSLKEAGPIERIIVRPKPGKVGRYELLLGKRRVAAAKLNKAKSLPASVRSLSDAEAMEYIAADAFTQLTLNPMEKAGLVKTLSAPIDKGGAGLTDAQIAAKFKRSKSWVSNLRRLIALPEELKAKVISREITETQARSLLPYKERPEVLTAIAADLQDNPGEYATRQKLEERAQHVAENVQAVGNSKAKKPAEAKARALTQSQALALLRPYLSNRDDLEILKSVIEETLRRFGSKRRSA